MICNKINEHKYIGKTNNFKRRRKEHKTLLRGNRHNNRYLQFAWNKYKEENFIFSIIEKCDIEEINDREIYWINYYNTYEGDGYNLHPGGYGGALPGELNPMYGVRGIENPLYGKKRSKEVREKISKYLKSIKMWQGENNPKYGVDLSGNKNPNCKLTKEIALQILKEYEENENLLQNDLAEKYNVSQRTVSLITRKEHWATRHLAS